MANHLVAPSLLERSQELASEWGVVCEDTFETESSMIAFGSRGNKAVVLKVVKQPGDEWHSGEVLQAFGGHGVAQVYEYVPGALLIERLRPGFSLVDLALTGRDEEATDILAGVMQLLQGSSPSAVQCATVQDWGRGFDKYLSSGDVHIRKDLVLTGQRVYTSLCHSERQPRLLHGDLQHYNVLFDSERGWLAIDPKGVIGEIEYEVGASLRNPIEQPELFLSRSTIERRLGQFTKRLNLDYERVLGWTFSQAVLSAIWLVEDGFAVDAMNPALRLAEIVRPN